MSSIYKQKVYFYLTLYHGEEDIRKKSLAMGQHSVIEFTKVIKRKGSSYVTGKIRCLCIYLYYGR